MERVWLKQYPAGVPHRVGPDLHLSLSALIAESLRVHRDRPAVRYLGRALSFGQLDEAAQALAAWLQAQGLERGDRVALMLPNVPSFPVAAVAVLRAGLVLVPLNPLAPARDLEHQLKDSGARVVIVLEHFAAALQAVLPPAPPRKVLVATVGDLLGAPQRLLVNQVARRVRRAVPPFDLPGAVRFKDALATGRGAGFIEPQIGPSDIATLQYTGGTTAPAKAAVLLHRNLVANVLQTEAWFRPAAQRVPADEHLTMACLLPLHHIFGLQSNLLLGLRLGACNVLLPDPLDAARVLKELARHRVHVLPAVDTLFALLADHPEAAAVDWGALVACIAGAMPLRESTARRWRERTGLPIHEGYGLSEASPTVTCQPLDAMPAAAGIGLPLPSTDVRIVDEDGNEVPAGRPGEIVVHGPQVMAGYWQRPDETAKAMTSDGGLRTGDIGVMDARGMLRIVDRKKDLIRVGGLDVVPSDVEQVIARMPGVRECAAVAAADHGEGITVKAVVVRADPALTEDEVRAFCEAHLTGYQRPRHIEFREDLPKTPIGKILRRQLRGAGA